MATIVNNPGAAPSTSDRTYIERTSDDGAGWAVAIIVLLAVLAVGAFLWVRYNRAPAAATPAPGANINVTLPTSNGGDTTGGTDAGTGGTQTQTPTPAQ
jgi:hypothetical protein